jgi:hypothetical protein
MSWLVGAVLANPCMALRDGMPDGPAGTFLYDGGLGMAHPICPRNEVGFGAGAYLLADTANFYGHIVASGNLGGRWAPTERFEVFGGVEFLRFDNVIGALSSSYLGLGHTHVGVSGLLWQGDTMGISANGKLVLPTAPGLYEQSFPVGVDLAVAGAWSPSESVRLTAQVGGLGAAAFSGAGAYPRAGVQLHAGAELRPWRPLGVSLQVDAGFGYTAPVDHVAAGLALRGAVGKRGGIELGAVIPLAGRERALATATLRGTFRLGAFATTREPVLLNLPVEAK